MRLFAESRGYQVVANFFQLIYGYDGNTKGFTFTDFKNEIDAGRPVMIQLEGHSMLGFGYDDTGQTIYVHNSWDYQSHTMTWGGSYSGMAQYGVTVLRLGSSTATTPSVTTTAVTSVTSSSALSGGNIAPTAVPRLPPEASAGALRPTRAPATATPQTAPALAVSPAPLRD